jgi:hypothetical protein
MFTEAFWLDVLSNFIPDFVIGVLIVGAISYINAKREKREIEFEERKKKTEKAIGYMKTLCIEMEENMNSATISHKNIEDFAESGYKFYSDYWDSLLLTGELPLILNLDIYKKFATFYILIHETNRTISLLLEMKLLKNDSSKKIVLYNLEWFVGLIKGNQNLIMQIKEHIMKSEEEINKINKEIRNTNLIYIIQDFFIGKISEDINKKPPRFKEG